MAGEEITRELAEVLRRHGVAGLSREAVAGPAAAQPGGAAASYIREIITGNQAFDEDVLNRVVNVLRK